jgi:hypothetical protein
MANKFRVSITTALGSCIAEDFAANSDQQIRDNTPDEVAICETTLLCATDSAALIDDDDVFLELHSMVDNIRMASEMTPERIAEEHAKQARALVELASMTVELH